MPTKTKQVIVEREPVNMVAPNSGSQLPLLLSIIALLGTVYTFSKVQTLEKNIGKNGVPGIAQISTSPQPIAEPTPDLTKMPALTDSEHIRGSKDAQVVLVEYSDYQCPFCHRFHPTMQQVVKEFGNKVAWVYRHYPLPFHPYAQKAAEAGECVAKLGGNDKFWQFTDMAYEKASKDDSVLAVDSLVSMAKSIGLDGTKVKACIDSGEMAAKVKSDMDGGSAAGVNGTPGTIVLGKNGKKDFVPGAYPFESVKATIEKVM